MKLRALLLVTTTACSVLFVRAAEPSIDRTQVFVEKVQRGDLVRTTRGSGSLVSRPGTPNMIAVLQIPASEAADVKSGLAALIDARQGLMKGTVAAVGAESQGKREVEITISEVPSGVAAGNPVTGSIETERATNVLYMFTGSPIPPGTSLSVFKLEPGGDYATRVTVQTGRIAGNKAEVLSGLSEGDKIIVTNMKPYEEFQRVKLN